jgi:7 transmembrane receptor (rhodopsin family)
VLFAKYSLQEYTEKDQSLVAVCLTQAIETPEKCFFLMTITVFFIIPLFILIGLYVKIAKKLISNETTMVKIRLNKPEVSLKARKQIILMLAIVVFSFFIFLLPFRVLTLWIILDANSDEHFKKLGIDKYFSLLFFSRIMLYTNSAINPILYNLFSSKFRAGFLKIWRCQYWVQDKNKICRNRMITITNSTNTSYLTHSFTGKTSRGTVSAEHNVEIGPHREDVEHKMNKNRQNEQPNANETTQFKVDDDDGDDDCSRRKCFLSTSMDDEQRYQLKISLSYDQDLTKYVFMEPTEDLPS